MKTSLSTRKHQYMRGAGIFLIAVALVAGMVGCSPVSDPDSDPTPEYDLNISSTAGGEVPTPGEGTFTYDVGTVVDLVAEAEEGYDFVNWTGDVGTIDDANCATTTITMLGNYAITANFEAISAPPQAVEYDLIIGSTEGGSVTTPGEGTFTYDEGVVVDLVAEAEEGYDFVNWTGDVGTITDPNSWNSTITMNGDHSITANFEATPPTQYDLTISSTAGGSVTTPGEGTFTYDCGVVVDLVAEAEEGYSFVEWSGDVDTIANINAAETTITMNSTYTITANFGLFTGGNGTAEDPYQIADWYSLDNLRNYLSSYFILMNDLDSNSAGYAELASKTANQGKGWQPIGNATENVGFTGSFDGQGHEICDLFIDRSGESDVGLFALVREAGVIENVGVNGNVTGYNNAGGLVGKNEGTVSTSYATGRVTGNDYVGGLVGKNEGTVSASYATGRVTGNDYVGGLVGKNDGAVSASYATGRVTGNDYVGGLVGKNDGTASNSYSTGSVTGTGSVGGLVGKNDGAVGNSFWDIETSGQSDSDGGTGKTTEEMQDIDTFSGAGWDIIAVANSSTRNTGYIWNIVDDVTYAFLSWQSV